MGTYAITYRDGGAHHRATVTTEELLTLHEGGQLAIVHHPVDPPPQPGTPAPHPSRE